MGNAIGYEKFLPNQTDQVEQVGQLSLAFAVDSKRIASGSGFVVCFRSNARLHQWGLRAKALAEK